MPAPRRNNKMVQRINRHDNLDPALDQNHQDEAEKENKQTDQAEVPAQKNPPEAHPGTARSETMARETTTVRGPDHRFD